MVETKTSKRDYKWGERMVYINKETLLLTLKFLYALTKDKSVAEIITLIKTLPTIKPKQAHWEIDCDGYYPYCSACRHEPTSGKMTKFCENCGAKMDVKENRKRGTISNE